MTGFRLPLHIHRRYFECLWMDADNNTVGTHSFSDMRLARVQGHWLAKEIRVGKIDRL
ncbi:MAG TPA: hypothetical protein VGT07_06925 [Steroidobacteraceae bacterium]|nr:hypothetical protein [Steroidobacteraceae bacterium]